MDQYLPGFPLADLKRTAIKRFLVEFDLQAYAAARAVAAGGPLPWPENFPWNHRQDSWITATPAGACVMH